MTKTATKLKRCPRCKETKGKESFGKHYSESYCKPCKSDYQKKYNVDKDHRVYLLRAYGLTQEDFNRMLKDQKGVCALCSQPPTESKNFCVDHDHETGRVRGLLCTRCNRGLGLLGDTLEHVERAVEYLSRNRVD